MLLWNLLVEVAGVGWGGGRGKMMMENCIKRLSF